MSNGVLVAGGGIAAQRFCARLRSRGFDGRIRVICDEPLAPYDRPPLSKQYLLGKANDQDLQLKPSRWYVEHQVELLIDRRARSLDPAARMVTLDGGERLDYDDLLIATGSEPRRLPQAEGFDNVHYLRTAADARRLRRALLPGARVVVIGGGFIGQEVASSALAMGAEVTIVEALAAPLERVLGARLGSWFVQLHGEQGVKFICGATVTQLRGAERVEELVLDDGRRIPCDLLVVGVGVAAAGGWLEGSGLPVDGVPVDGGGRSSIAHVFAAGDVARPFDPIAGVHRQAEHWEAAVRGGSSAADALLGEATPRSDPTSFWSDLHGVRIQYLGNRLGDESIEIEGNPDERDFTAIFRRGSLPVAALLVGRPRALPEWRRRLASSHETLATLKEGDLNGHYDANPLPASG